MKLAGTITSLVLLLSVLIATATMTTPRPQDQGITTITPEVQSVSLVELIANPANFHGKLVQVIGFCRLEFEGNALYLHREDFEHAISKNGLWLQVGWPVPENRRTMSDKYVIVEATFSAEDRGHFGAFSGSLINITRMDRWVSQAEIESSLRLQRLQ